MFYNLIELKHNGSTTYFYSDTPGDTIAFTTNDETNVVERLVYSILEKPLNDIISEYVGPAHPNECLVLGGLYEIPVPQKEAHTSYGLYLETKRVKCHVEPTVTAYIHHTFLVGDKYIAVAVNASLENFNSVFKALNAE